MPNRDIPLLAARGDRARPPTRSSETSARSRLRRLWRAALVALAIACGAPAGHADIAEYEAKAAFLYNLAKFIQWPAAEESTKTALVFGILGEDPFGASFDRAFFRKSVHGRTVVVRRAATLEQLGRCHLLFVSRSEEHQVSRILETLESSSTVTVGDMSDFIAMGGMIQLDQGDERVRFAINTSRAERAGLKISSRVLSLSHIVVSR
jgi:hypothetical protein